MDENRQSEQMPHVIGRYQIQESIGFGAMGAVYKAFDPLIKRTLAIKTIRLDIPRQSPQYKSFIERFYHEARISGTLSHPNIVTLFDIGEEGGIPYLAMEFVEGETISSILEHGQRFNPERVISLVSQIASAVDYAHSKGVIHRDIKPSNLILYEGERVKVTDFGIAKLIDAEMTQSGTLLGTPSYMSPEQAMGDKLDGRSDIFSLGVCAFEMLSGEQPFPGNNVTSILYKLVHVDPIQPADLEMNGLVPQKWHEVFSRVLAKRPDDRYQTATDFVQDLEYCLGAWFGSAMGDDPLAEVGDAPASDETTALPVLARPTGAAPVSAVGASTLPPFDAAPSREAAPAAASTPPPAPPAEEDEDELPATIMMKAPGDRAQPHAPADTPVPSTVLLSAVVPPPPPPSEESATVLMKATSLPAAPPPPEKGKPQEAPDEGESATVLMKAGSLPAGPPVKPQAPPAPPPPEPQERTVMMSAAVLTAAGAPGAGDGEGHQDRTVMMPAAPPAAPARPPDARPASRDVSLNANAPTAKPPAPPRIPPVPPAAAKPAARPVASAASPGTVPANAATPPMGMPPLAPGASAPAPPAGKKGAPLGLILGGVGLLVFLLAIGGGVVLFKRFAASSGPSMPPSTTPATTLVAGPPSTVAMPPAMAGPVGSARIVSEPAGATVSLNGEARGVTPLDLPNLAFGSYELKVELKGYAPTVQKIDITEQAPRPDLKLTLARPAEVVTTADITSTPSGASVTIDGAAAGVTPLAGHRLKAGSHRVEITHDGFEPFSSSFTVRAGKKARVDAPLRAIVRATPTPAPVESVDTARVYVNAASELDVLAKKISGSSASYPSDRAPRLKSGDAVSVTVSYVVSEAGDVTDLRVVESGGKVLDEEVTGAIRRWKYSPAMKKGVKVKARVTFKQTFRAG